MEALKAEIERKKKQNDALRAQAAKGGDEGAAIVASSSSSSSKYIRVSDRKRLAEQQLEDQQRSLEEGRSKRAKVESDSAATEQNERATLEAASVASSRAEVERRYNSMSVKEIKVQLRGLRQPITFFAETDSARLLRVIECFLNQTHEDEDRLGRNESVEDEEEAELEAEDEAERGKGAVVGAGADPDRDSDDEEEERNNPSSVEWDHTLHFSTLGLTPEKTVYKFFRALLKQWEKDLRDREDAVKRSTVGRKETATQKQCKDYIRPLFRMCKKRDVPYDILTKLELMVKHCEEGNFTAANDQYI
ncbi:Prp18 domain-containing protein, partial [Ochromonadaceae sp. CCMP2298]